MSARLPPPKKPQNKKHKTHQPILSNQLLPAPCWATGWS